MRYFKTSVPPLFWNNILKRIKQRLLVIETRNQLYNGFVKGHVKTLHDKKHCNAAPPLKMQNTTKIPRLNQNIKALTIHQISSRPSVTPSS